MEVKERTTRDENEEKKFRQALWQLGFGWTSQFLKLCSPEEALRMMSENFFSAVSLAGDVAAWRALMQMSGAFWALEKETGSEVEARAREKFYDWLMDEVYFGLPVVTQRNGKSEMALPDTKMEILKFVIEQWRPVPDEKKQKSLLFSY